jgi:8-amino-7-oxononanoate synthase
VGKPSENPGVNRRSPSARGSGAERLDDALGEEIARLREAGRYRFLRTVQGAHGPRMRVDGRDVLMLAGSNYLDLAGDPRVTAAAAEAARAHGAAAGGSRLINGNTPLHEALEAQLARFLGVEASLLFSTGYMANLGVITALAGPGDAVFSDSWNHASIIDACRLSGARTFVFRHNDAEDLARQAAGAGGFRRRLLVLDGVYSMDGDVARLRELVPVARHHDLLVVLDDAHGVGVLGDGGRGAAELEGVQPDVWIGNLGKALGSFGAWAAGSARLREFLLNTSRPFIFTCALAPPCAGAALAALDIVRREPERRRRLLERAERLRKGLERAGFDTGASETHIVPAIVGDAALAMALCERALAAGVYAQGIRYPSVPEGTARIRFTPSAAHTDADIDHVVELFASLSR